MRGGGGVGGMTIYRLRNRLRSLSIDDGLTVLAACGSSLRPLCAALSANTAIYTGIIGMLVSFDLVVI